MLLFLNQNELLIEAVFTNKLFFLFLKLSFSQKDNAGNNQILKRCWISLPVNLLSPGQVKRSFVSRQNFGQTAKFFCWINRIGSAGDWLVENKRQDQVVLLISLCFRATQSH